jgi:hypothetical protein
LDWQKVMARLLEILTMLDRHLHSRLYLTYHSLALLNINFVTKNNLTSVLACFHNPDQHITNKREVGRVPRGSLDEKLISPAVQRLETLRIVDIVD